MKRYVITTLGCKVNQCESVAMGELLHQAGYVRADGDREADLVIINTCTVTGKAAMQSRQAIRQSIRNHPHARVVVTGCYAQTGVQEIEAIPGVDLIVGHNDKLEVATYLRRLEPERSGSLLFRKSRPDGRFASLPPVSGTGRTRAFLKIQDGCNTFCTYCIVPHARGRSRSMPSEDVLTHLAKLKADGFHEVVLTGIHLGAYGLDLDPPVTLSRLLKSMADPSPIHRIRISSIEPTEIDDDMIRLMTNPASGLCPHFHVPLQSGDNAVLSRMGRPYSREDYRERILAIRSALPHAAIGADVMVGFPGEDDAAFENSYDLIAELPITYLHVFPFSPRKGTPAAEYGNKVPERIAKTRSRQLRQLGQQKKKAFYQSQIGSRVEVLVESDASADTTGRAGIRVERELSAGIDRRGDAVGQPIGHGPDRRLSR